MKHSTPDRSVLLYSGGMDSVCASWLLSPDVCLYVQMGGRYGAKEHAAHRPPPRGELLLLTGVLDLTRFEREDLIVPQRNAYLVLLAAQYGRRIMLAATAGDRSTDKDTPFVELMTGLLHHLWAPSHWNEGGDHRVELPLAGMSKRQIVAAYLAAGGDADLLTTCGGSCYSAHSLACGACKACARRWVALKLNGIDKRFDADPREYFTPEMIERALAGRYRGELEDRDILEALECGR